MSGVLRAVGVGSFPRDMFSAPKTKGGAILSPTAKYKLKREALLWMKQNMGGGWKVKKLWRDKWVIAFKEPNDAMFFKLMYL